MIYSLHCLSSHLIKSLRCPCLEVAVLSVADKWPGSVALQFIGIFKAKVDEMTLLAGGGGL